LSTNPQAVENAEYPFLRGNFKKYQLFLAFLVQRLRFLKKKKHVRRISSELGKGYFGSRDEFQNNIRPG
jgi:hypothetical protein